MPRTKPPDNSAPDNKQISGDWSIVKAEFQERLEQGRADRVQTQAQIINGDLVLRSAFALTMGSIYAVYRTRVLSLDDNAGSTVAALLNIPENQSHIIRKNLSELAYDMTGAIKNDMEEFVENN